MPLGQANRFVAEIAVERLIQRVEVLVARHEGRARSEPEVFTVEGIQDGRRTAEGKDASCPDGEAGGPQVATEPDQAAERRGIRSVSHPSRRLEPERP